MKIYFIILLRKRVEICSLAKNVICVKFFLRDNGALNWL